MQLVWKQTNLKHKHLLKNKTKMFISRGIVDKQQEDLTRVAEMEIQGQSQADNQI